MRLFEFTSDLEPNRHFKGTITVSVPIDKPKNVYQIIDQIARKYKLKYAKKDEGNEDSVELIYTNNSPDPISLCKDLDNAKEIIESSIPDCYVLTGLQILQFGDDPFIQHIKRQGIELIRNPENHGYYYRLIAQAEEVTEIATGRADIEDFLN